MARVNAFTRLRHPMVAHPVLICLSLVTLGIGFTLGRRLRTSSIALTAAAAVPPLSIIIPARNEEQNLPKLLASITAQSVRPAEVIVVDDHSADRTAEIARTSGATVITAAALPEGWRGKTWACEQGARTTRGELLLFVDSDAWFEPDGLRQLLAFYEGGAFSLGPWHVVRAPHEQLSLFFNLAMNLGTVPDALFGQLLLVDRNSYDAVGGHAAVRGRTLENFHLAGRFRERGVRVQSRPGRGIVSFRMYPQGVRELVDGWTRGFAAGAGGTSRGVLIMLVAWIGGLLLPVQALLEGEWIVAAVLYAVLAAQVLWLGRKVGGFRWYAAAAYPLALAFFFAVFARSAMRIGSNVTWKGRVIRAD